MKESVFLQKVKEFYNDNIEVVEYENTKDRSTVKCRCKIHGVFIATVHNLVHHKSGCPLCRVEKSNSPYRNTEQLIYKLKKRYGDTFVYDKVNARDKQIILVCPTHGDFSVTPNYALTKKVVCPICRYESRKQHHATIIKNEDNRIKKTINKKR